MTVMRKKLQKGAVPLIPLLVVALVATTYVAVNYNESNSKVLGKRTTNTGSSAEIKRVELAREKTKTKLENMVESKGLRNEVQIRNEGGEIRARVSNEEQVFKGQDGVLNLKVRESTSAAQKKVETQTEKKVNLTPVGTKELEIEDQGLKVRTNFPITVNQVDDTISVTTPKGDVKVKQLPSTAVDNLMKNDVFNKVVKTEITESSTPTQENGEKPVFKVSGTDKLRFLGVFPVETKVSAEVNTETGETTSVTRPWYIKTFGFLFSR